MRLPLKPLEDLYRYTSGVAHAIPLTSLISLINHGYLAPDLGRKLSFNIALSDGTVVRDVSFPLDLSDEDGYKDALRLIRAMLASYNQLTEIERRILHLLASRLQIRIPSRIASRRRGTIKAPNSPKRHSLSEIIEISEDL